MTALRDALEIPDEPARARRGIVTALCGGAVLIGAGVCLARVFALGGTTRPFLAVGILTAVVPTVAAWLLTGPHQQRIWLGVGVMVLGLASLPVGAAGATPSVSRLKQVVDGLGLPGRVVHEVSLGNGRCRTACSELRRTVFIDGISYVKAQSLTSGALRLHNFTETDYAHNPDAPARIDAAKGKVLIQLELRVVNLSRTRLSIVVLANGPAPSHSVG